MSNKEKIATITEFQDQVFSYRERLDRALEESFSPQIRDLIEKTRQNVRASLNIKPENLVVVLGEQAHGIHKSDKVLGKRLLAKNLEHLSPQIVNVELFATHAPIGSKPELYRLSLPQPNSNNGYCSVNIISGWNKRKNVATAGFRCPTKDELKAAIDTISTLYGTPKGEAFKKFTIPIYEGAVNYAQGNIQLLQAVEREISLEIKKCTTEDVLDTKIALNGGLEVILPIWPSLVNQINQNLVEGLNSLNPLETPFQLYHQCEEEYLGVSRTDSYFLETSAPDINSQIESRCLTCGHKELTTPGEILEEKRKLSWKAVPRVILYSTIRIFDGHITGGDSVYNQTAKQALGNFGLPYFPTINIDKQNQDGTRSGIFQYTSSATIKEKGQGLDRARLYVKEGKAPILDLILSIGINQLKDAISETIEKPLTTQVRVACPPPLPKYRGDVINIPDL